MKGLSTKTYLTRTLLNKIFKKDLTTDEIEDLMMQGKIIKRFSYYLPSEALLRELGCIKEQVIIVDFNRLAKTPSFILRDLMEIFNCNKDTAQIVAGKYFYKKHNYLYKKEVLQGLILDGEEELIT